MALFAKLKFVHISEINDSETLHEIHLLELLNTAREVYNEKHNKNVTLKDKKVRLTECNSSYLINVQIAYLNWYDAVEGRKKNKMPSEFNAR